MGSSQAANFSDQPQTLSPRLAGAPGPSPALPDPVPEHPISERLWLDLPPIREAQWELGSSQVVKTHVQHLLKAHSWSPWAGQGCCCAQQSSLCLGCSITWSRGHSESLRPGTFGHLSRSEGLNQSRALSVTRCHSVHAVPPSSVVAHEVLSSAMVAHVRCCSGPCGSIMTHAVPWRPELCCGDPCSAMWCHGGLCSAGWCRCVRAVPSSAVRGRCGAAASSPI